MATDSQRTQIGGALSSLSSNDGAALKGASKSQLRNLKSTLSRISSALNSSSSGGGGGGGGGITSDSGDATRTESTIGADIESITRRSGVGEEPDTSALEELQASQEREIERQQRLLESRRANAVAGIEEGFGVEREATEFQQKRETGQTSVDLARAGGYLGVTASQSGVLQNLVISQRGELRALESAKQDAINTANQAYEDRDFELAQEKLKSAREIEAEIFNRKNVFFNQQMDIMGETRAQAQNARESEQFLRDQANERLDRIIEAGILPDFDDIRSISEGLGVSVDETNKILKAAEETKALDNKERKTDRELAIQREVNNTPRDRTIVIDGVVYRGNKELSKTGSTLSAAQQQAQRENNQKLAFSQDLQGFYGGREDNEILSIPIEEALTNYPDITDHIKEVYEALDVADNDKEIAEKMATGEWDIATVDYGSATGPTQIVYDKPAYEQAIKNWAEQGTAVDDSGWFGGPKKDEQEKLDKQQDTVVVDGETYTGQGVWDSRQERYVAPIQPDDFTIQTIDPSKGVKY